MAENSAIQWTDHTFNPWIGCAKVSAGCKHCYAETLMDTRYGRVEWGVNGTRSRTSDANWKKPLAWNRAAEKAGKPARVFCASLADVFEDRPELVPWRSDLWALVERTPWLRYQLLTKRPENVMGMVPESWRDGFPPHVWIGTSVEDQAAADERIPHLLQIPAKVRFLSCEPLIGPVDLKPQWLHEHPGTLHLGPGHYPGPAIHWVIAGGESGPGARPCDVAWLRSLRDQCAAAGVPYFLKQLGSRPHSVADRIGPIPKGIAFPNGFYRHLNDHKGGDMEEWPADLRLRGFPGGGRG
jgi:protein gp37